MIVGGVVAKVCDGEDGAAAGIGVGLVALGPALFAAVLGALESDEACDFIPVFGVQGFSNGWMETGLNSR